MVRSERSGGVLVASMLSSFLNSWLTARLPDLSGGTSSSRPAPAMLKALVDFSRSDVHVAIRVGRGGWPRLHVEKLFDEYLVPVCSPELLGRHGSLPGPGSVATYPLLHSSSEPWDLWTEGCDYDNDRWPERGAAFDDSMAILVAASHWPGSRTAVAGAWPSRCLRAVNSCAPALLPFPMDSAATSSARQPIWKCRKWTRSANGCCARPRACHCPDSSGTRRRHRRARRFRIQCGVASASVLRTLAISSRHPSSVALPPTCNASRS